MFKRVVGWILVFILIFGTGVLIAQMAAQSVPQSGATSTDSSD